MRKCSEDDMSYQNDRVVAWFFIKFGNTEALMLLRQIMNSSAGCAVVQNI